MSKDIPYEQLKIGDKFGLRELPTADKDIERYIEEMDNVGPIYLKERLFISGTLIDRYGIQGRIGILSVIGQSKGKRMKMNWRDLSRSGRLLGRPRK